MVASALEAVANMSVDGEQPSVGERLAGRLRDADGKLKRGDPLEMTAWFKCHGCGLLTDERYSKATEELGKWLNLPDLWVTTDSGILYVDEQGHGEWVSFDPFTDLSDARLLLKECDRRGLMPKVSHAILCAARPIPPHFQGTRNRVSFGLLATHKQITAAVYEVVRNLV